MGFGKYENVYIIRHARQDLKSRRTAFDCCVLPKLYLDIKKETQKDWTEPRRETAAPVTNNNPDGPQKPENSNINQSNYEVL